MKTRNGFVSNSSSSSFIIRTSDEMSICIKKNIKFYEVKELIKSLTPLLKMQEIKESLEDKIPYFMYERIYVDVPNLQELIELEEKSPNCCITEPYDRDRAQEENIYFEVFEGDL